MKLKLQLFISERAGKTKAQSSDVDMYLNLDLDTEELKRDYHLTLPRGKKSREHKKLPRRFGHVIH